MHSLLPIVVLFIGRQRRPEKSFYVIKSKCCADGGTPAIGGDDGLAYVCLGNNAIGTEGRQMTGKNELFESLIEEIKGILGNNQERDAKLKSICKLLKDKVSYYNWVGFYFIGTENKNELLLGPFEGEPTEHVKIPFGKGICGQAAQQGKTFLVQDVSKETNYLSCNVRVKSEIVVPIFKGKVIGELDIDSHFHSPFTMDDEQFLGEVGRMVSDLYAWPTQSIRIKRLTWVPIFPKLGDLYQKKTFVRRIIIYIRV